VRLCSLPRSSFLLHIPVGNALDVASFRFDLPVAAECIFRGSANIIDLKRETGAGEGIRTLDPDLGNVVLWRLWARRASSKRSK